MTVRVFFTFFQFKFLTRIDGRKLKPYQNFRVVIVQNETVRAKWKFGQITGTKDKLYRYKFDGGSIDVCLSLISEIANLINRALIYALKRSVSARRWTPSLEHTSTDSVVATHFHRHSSPGSSIRFSSTTVLWLSAASIGPLNNQASHSSVTYQAILKSLSNSRDFNAVYNNRLRKSILFFSYTFAAIKYIYWITNICLKS